MFLPGMAEKCHKQKTGKYGLHLALAVSDQYSGIIGNYKGLNTRL